MKGIIHWWRGPFCTVFQEDGLGGEKIKKFLIKISGRGDILLFLSPEGVSPIPRPHMNAPPPTLHRRTFENAVLLPINR